MGTIQVYITNSGETLENDCCIGKWIRLPIAEDCLTTILSNVFPNNEEAEIIITDYESAFSNLEITEFSNLTEVNKLAEALARLTDAEQDLLAAILECEVRLSVAEILEYIEQLNSFCLLRDVFDERSLGICFAEEFGTFNDVPTHLHSYIDYAAYGNDIKLESSGLLTMFTSWGFLLDNR